MSDLVFNVSPWGTDNLEELQPADFLVVSGLEGPQVIATWTPPTYPAARIMIRRKLHEYPRDLQDGSLVLDDGATASTNGTIGDLGTDLLPSNASPGDSQWWYYRMFVLPAPREVADQFSGDGTQLGVVNTVPIDVQQYQRMRIFMTNNGAFPDTIAIRTAPELAGPWLALATKVVAPGDTVTYMDYLHGAKYLRVDSTGGNLNDTTFVPLLPPIWFSSDALSVPVLVYKTGRHIDLFKSEYHVPRLEWQQDGDQEIPLTQVEVGAESFNLGLSVEPMGALHRFLSIIGLELDRVHAYMEDLGNYGTIDDVPPWYLKHIAGELGWPLNTVQDLLGQREEIFRATQFYKRKGTITLFEPVVWNEAGIAPALVEGGGRVLRVANPDLF